MSNTLADVETFTTVDGPTALSFTHAADDVDVDYTYSRVRIDTDGEHEDTVAVPVDEPGDELTAVRTELESAGYTVVWIEAPGTGVRGLVVRPGIGGLEIASQVYNESTGVYETAEVENVGATLSADLSQIEGPEWSPARLVLRGEDEAGGEVWIAAVEVR